MSWKDELEQLLVRHPAEYRRLLTIWGVEPENGQWYVTCQGRRQRERPFVTPAAAADQAAYQILLALQDYNRAHPAVEYEIHQGIVAALNRNESR